MKTIRTAIAALLIAGGAVTAFAFTNAQNEEKVIEVRNTTPLYWYDSSNNLLPGSPSIEPSNGCTEIGTGCAKGFADENADPEVDTPDQQRQHDSN